MVSHSVNQSSINVQDARRLQPCQESCFLLNPAGALVGLESNLRNIRVEDLLSRYHLSCSGLQTRQVKPSNSVPTYNSAI